MFGMVKSSVKRSKCANYATLRYANLRNSMKNKDSV